MRLPTINPSLATGVVHKIVGLNKEIIGQIFDRSKLQKSGQIEQEQGTAKLAALQAQTKAEGQAAKAEAQAAKADSLAKAQKKVDDEG